MGGDERSLSRKSSTTILATASRGDRRSFRRRPRGRFPSTDQAMAEPAAEDAPRVAAGAVHGDRRPPRRRGLRAGRDRRPLDRRRLRRGGSCAAPAATRAPTTGAPIRSSWRRSARRSSGRPRTSSATPGSRSSTSPTAPSPTTSRCASSSCARSAPSGPDAVLAVDPETLFYDDGGVNHVDHRAAGIAAVDAVYPAARNAMAFPWLARDGLEPHTVRRLYLFWSGRADGVGRRQRRRSAARSTRCAPTPARSASPRSSRPRIRDWAKRGGRRDRRRGGRGAAGDRDRRGRRAGRCGRRPTRSRAEAAAGA